MHESAQLHARFTAHLRSLLESMTRATTGLPPGPRRLLVAVETFWEACFRTRYAAAQMFAAAQRTGSEAELERRAHILERLLVSELEACRIAQPESLAPGLASEICDIARAEAYAGQRLPAQRRRLIGFIESRIGASPSLWSTAAA